MWNSKQTGGLLVKWFLLYTDVFYAECPDLGEVRYMNCRGSRFWQPCWLRMAHLPSTQRIACGGIAASVNKQQNQNNFAGNVFTVCIELTRPGYGRFPWAANTWLFSTSTYGVLMVPRPPSTVQVEFPPRGTMVIDGQKLYYTKRPLLITAITLTHIN